MVFANVIHEDFQYGKWIVDGILVLAGSVLGGALVIMAVLSILLSGVIIMFFHITITKILAI